MVPFGYLTGTDQGADGRTVEVSEERLRALLQPLLAMVEVDEDWYRASNPDVAEAIKAGRLRSGRDHFVAAGYYEDRLPRPAVVDERWYLREYPDVAEALRLGQCYSAQHHFATAGYREGRLPRAGWSLLAADSRKNAA